MFSHAWLEFLMSQLCTQIVKVNFKYIKNNGRVTSFLEAAVTSSLSMSPRLPDERVQHFKVSFPVMPVALGSYQSRRPQSMS